MGKTIYQKHIHIVFFFAPGSLEIQLYCELNSTVGEMFVINVWTQFKSAFRHVQ